MVPAILELVPVAILVAVAGASWRGSKKFTTIDLQLQTVLTQTEKCEEGLHSLGERVAGVEGQLKRINGKE